MSDDRLFIDSIAGLWAEETLDLWASTLPQTRSLIANIAIYSSTAEPESPFSLDIDERLFCNTLTGQWASESIHAWAGTYPQERNIVANVAMTSSTSDGAVYTFGDVRSLIANIALTSSTEDAAARPGFIRKLYAGIALESSTGDAGSDLRIVMDQASRARLGWLNSRLLIEISIGNDTFRISHEDYEYTYAGSTLHYEGYLLNISGLGEFAASDGEAINTRVVLTLADEAFGSYDYLSLWNVAVPFAGSEVSIHEIRLMDDEEEFNFDARTLLHKLTIERISNLKPGMSFDVECSSRLFAKRNAQGQEVLTKALYPYCDPNDLGKPRSILYGDLYYVPCRCVKAGAIDLLAQNLDGNAYYTTIYLSGVRQLEFTGPPYVIRIDEEQIYCSSLPVSHVIYGASRGWNGTTVTSHKKSSAVLDYLSSVIYEVSKHPVQSISAVRVLDVMETMHPTSGYTVRAYTGKSGDAHPSYPGTAVLDFNLPVFIAKQIEQKVASEHSHSDIANTGTTTSTSTNTSEGSHSHGTSSLSTLTKRGVSSSYNGVTNPANAYDYSEVTYATLDPSSTGNHLTITLESGGVGTLSKIMVRAKIRHATGPAGNNLKITCNSSTLYESNQMLLNDTDGLWLGWQLTTSTWPSTVVFGVSANSGSHANYDIYEVEVDHYYTPSVDAGPASGVASTSSSNSSSSTAVTTYVSASSILGGLTVADMLIGEEVTVDVKGYEDVDGSITGVTNYLIERPDYVIEHMLKVLMGFEASDMGDAISTECAAWFDQRSWKFAFIMHDIGDSMDVVLQNIAFQCGTALVDWAGKIDLKPLLVAPSAAYRWDWCDSKEGWSGTGASLTAGNSVLSMTASVNDSQLSVSNLSIPGAYYNQVVVRLKRTAGAGWDGYLWWSTASNAYAGYRFVSQPSGLSDWVEICFDMTNPTYSADAWISNTITALRLDLGSLAGDAFDIDWIEVRSSESPLPHTRLNWEFSESSTRGWEVQNAVMTPGDSYASISASASDPILYNDRTPLGFYGSSHSRVIVRFKRTAGSGWDGNVFYSTPAHAFSSSYYLHVDEPAGSSDWIDCEWNMESLTVGGGDWLSSYINGIRIDLGSGIGDTFQIESIRIEHSNGPFVVDSDMLIDPPIFRWSGTADSKTSVRGFYARDYRGTTGRGEVIMPDVPGDAYARGYIDCIDMAWSPVGGPGKLSVDLDLKAIRYSTQAREVMCGWGRKWGYPTLTVEMRINWHAISISPGDAIDYTCPVLGQKYYRVTAVRPDPVSRVISVTAETWL